MTMARYLVLTNFNLDTTILKHYSYWRSRFQCDILVPGISRASIHSGRSLTMAHPVVAILLFHLRHDRIGFRQTWITSKEVCTVELCCETSSKHWYIKLNKFGIQWIQFPNHRFITWLWAVTNALTSFTEFPTKTISKVNFSDHALEIVTCISNCSASHAYCTTLLYILWGPTQMDSRKGKTCFQLAAV